MKPDHDNIVGIFAFVVTILAFPFLFKSCFNTAIISDPYKQEKKACKNKCLPKPYDPKYLPDQCVCVEGEAK